MDDLWNMLLAFIGILFVLLLTYYATRYLAKHYKTYANTKHMQILERLQVGKEKNLAVVSIKGRMFLIGISEQNISLLTDLPEFSEADFKQEQGQDFAAVLMQNLKEKASWQNIKDKIGYKKQK